MEILLPRPAAPLALCVLLRPGLDETVLSHAFRGAGQQRADQAGSASALVNDRPAAGRSKRRAMSFEGTYA